MSDGGTFLQLSLSIRFSSNAGDTARWGLLPEVCKCVNAVALEMRRWAALCVCVCVCVRTCVCTYSSSFSSSSFSSSSLPFLLLVLSFTSLPSLISVSHDHQFASPLCAVLFLSLKGRRREVRWPSAAVDGRVVGEGWMPLCTQVNCLRGQGLTQSSRCVYMPPFTAI